MFKKATEVVIKGKVVDVLSNLLGDMSLMIQTEEGKMIQEHLDVNVSATTIRKHYLNTKISITRMSNQRTNIAHITILQAKES